MPNRNVTDRTYVALRDATLGASTEFLNKQVFLRSLGILLSS
jgi:hypothetical protein